MGNEQSVNVKLRVIGVNAHYSNPHGDVIGSLDWSTMTPNPPTEPPRPVRDPEYVIVTITLPDKNREFDTSGTIMMKTSDARKLSLMVGDMLNFTIVKDSA